MKMIKGRILTVLFTAASMMIFVGCGSSSGKKAGGGTKKFTSTSGFKVNDQRGWFFNGNKTKPNVKPWQNMVFIEGGTFTMGLVKDDVMKDWNNSPRRMQVSSFFIGEAEVTNYEYREYLTWLKVVFPTNEPMYKAIYEGALPDPAVFSNKLSADSFSTENYLMSPEFSYYPVVGLTWLQANNYCDWLTDRANEAKLMEKGILSKDYYQNEEWNFKDKTFSAEQYKNNNTNVQDAIDTTRIARESKIPNRVTNTRILNANRGTRSLEVQPFRLPTEAEWEYAALALPENREYNEYKGKQVAQNDLRGVKGKHRGQYLDNFKVGRGDYSGIGGYGNDGSAITNDVKKYPSNDFGLYGMYGNVAEWTADVYRPMIDDEANDFNYFRGNVFKTTIDDPNGGFVKYGEADIEFDTLNNGKLVYRGLPGSYKKEVEYDYTNYRDGDAMSSLDTRVTTETVANTSDMYNAPKRQFRVDEKGKVILEKDTQTRTTNISDEVRVVKGGSWKDPIYWLDPGQRRYLHQAEATSWIGFRVAQDYKGNFESKRTKRGSK